MSAMRLTGGCSGFGHDCAAFATVADNGLAASAAPFSLSVM
jgi:hypothetical protein